jgi:hypothetical protein
MPSSGAWAYYRQSSTKQQNSRLSTRLEAQHSSTITMVKKEIVDTFIIFLYATLMAGSSSQKSNLEAILERGKFFQGISCDLTITNSVKGGVITCSPLNNKQSQGYRGGLTIR